MNMNDEQQAAFDKIIKWFRNEPQKQCLTLGGYAGVGKTYLVSRLVSEGFAIIKVLTPTGKAAQVLRKKGVPADTIHSFIYTYEGEDEETHEMIFSRKETHARPQLLIVDESSMVPLPIYNDLLQTGLRILWVGDHGQLEPVGEDAGLMRNPEIRLETIMRQAAESPILSLAHTTRTGGLPTLGADPRLTVDFIRGIDTGRASADFLLSFDQILVAFNRTRVFLNMQIRAAQQRKALIEPGEKLICLMNNRRKGLFNGMLVTVLEVRKDYGDSIECLLETDDGRTPLVDVWKGHFNKDRRVSEPPRGLGIFDYGYAITCHKCVAPGTLVETSQGLLRIDEVQESTGQVGTADGPAAFDQLVRNPVAEALVIRTERGYEVTVTPDHKMMAWSGEAYQLTEGSSLVPGTFLRLLRGAALDTVTLPALPTPPTCDPRSKPVRFPSLMTTELAQWLGHMVADGTLTTSLLRLAKRHPEVVDVVANLSEQLFGLRPTVTDRHHYRLLELSSVPIADWCHSIGGMAPNAKAVPRVVLQSPLSIHASFLRGLFEDGSVALKKGGLDHVEWTTCVEEMSRVVQVMLLRLGITSSRAKYRNQWRVSIYGDSVDVFAARIGFVSKMKTERLRLPHSKDNRERVPVAMSEVSWTPGHDCNAKNRGYLSRVEASKRGINERRLDFVHDRIKTIEKTTCESWCFRVPTIGRFLQNGFDGSNSQGSEFPSVLVVEEPSERWSMARWRYTAITRAAERLEYRSDELLEPLGQEAQPSLFTAPQLPEPARFSLAPTPAERHVARVMKVDPAVVTVKPGAGRYDGFFSFASGGASR